MIEHIFLALIVVGTVVAIACISVLVKRANAIEEVEKEGVIRKKFSCPGWTQPISFCGIMPGGNTYHPPSYYVVVKGEQGETTHQISTQEHANFTEGNKVRVRYERYKEDGDVRHTLALEILEETGEYVE